MAEQGVPEGQLLPVAGGEPVRLSDDVVATVYPSQHSCVWTKAGGMNESDTVCLGDLGVTHQERLAHEARRARLSRRPRGLHVNESNESNESNKGEHR